MLLNVLSKLFGNFVSVGIRIIFVPSSLSDLLYFCKSFFDIVIHNWHIVVCVK